VDLPVGKMVILGCVVPEVRDAMLSLAATFCVQSPFSRRGNSLDLKPEEIVDRHFYDSPLGDCFTALAIFTEWVSLRRRNADTRRWCRRHFIEEQRLYEMLQLRHQFVTMLRDAGVMPKGPETTGEDRWTGSRDFKRKRTAASARTLTEKDAEDSLEGDWLDPRHMQAMLSRGWDQDGTLADALIPPHLTVVLQGLVCMALYPNYARADDGNANRISTEWLYNTRLRPLISMHPSSVFYGAADAPGPSLVVCYQKLLETRAVYLVGCSVAPLIPSLLLTARYIDTDEPLTRILLDGWLMLTCASEGRSLLTQTCALRTALDHAVAQQLWGPNRFAPAPGPTDEPSDLPDLFRETATSTGETPDGTLGARLAAFLRSPVACPTRTVAHNEAIRLLVDPRAAPEGEEAAGDLERLQPLKGGRRVTAYLTHGSLRDTRDPTGSTSRHMRTRYACPLCGASGLWNSHDVAAHAQICGAQPPPPARSTPAPFPFAQAPGPVQVRMLGTPLAISRPSPT